MRLLSVILLAVLAASSPAPVDHTALSATVVADSMYDAGAIDSLAAYANRMMARASAQRDSVLLGRMIYYRGRARLALRDPHAPEDFARALEIATALNDSIGRMNALGLTAFVAVNQGHFDESIRLNEERIALARALHQRGSEGWGHLLIGYAELYREHFPRARDEYVEAWHAFHDANRPREQLSASIGLGRALELLGRYSEARVSYQQAWLTARRLGDRGQEADAINNLGEMEEEHGDLSLAVRYFTRAYEIKRDLKSFDIASVAHNLAAVDQMIGRYAHAESTLAQAMSTSTNGMLDVGMALDVGRLRMARGRYAGASQSFRDLLAQRTRLPHKTRIEAAAYLALALEAQDSLPAAQALLDRELATLESDDPTVWRTDALLAWSDILRANGNSARAQHTAHLAWLDATARGDSTMMVLSASTLSLCERALGNEANAFAWLERARRAFETSREAGDFQWREARRAMLSRTLIESGDVLRAYPPDAPEEQRARAHFDFLQQVDSRTLLERVTDPRRFDNVSSVLARPPTSHDLQSRVLHAGECFLDVSMGKHVVYVFVLTPAEFRAHVIDDPDDALVRRIDNFARLFSHAHAARALEGADAAAKGLGEVIFAGAADVLRGSTRVYLALDGVIATAPFGLLVCPGESQPLIAAREVVSVPSAAVLRYLRGRDVPVPAESSILAVASDTGKLAGAREEANFLAWHYGATRMLHPERSAFLAGVSHFDVVHVASHVHVDAERPWHSGVLIGARPTGASAAAQDSTATDPLRLSAADSRTVAAQMPEDPFVRASEIANRQARARLVVLSACESARGRGTQSEGVLGIASSFVSAGSRAVVASLWEVDDRVTAELMKNFYGELALGRSVASALQYAQLRTRRRHPDPFFWAGFVVIGDGDATFHITPHPRLAAGAWLAGICLIVGMITAWVVWRRPGRRSRIGA